MTREELIAACIKSISNCHNSEGEQQAENLRSVGEAWALLQDGCDFTILEASPQRIIVSIVFEGFNAFEYGSDLEQLEHKTIEIVLKRERNTNLAENRTTENYLEDREYPRQHLLEICARACIAQSEWRNRDSASAQQGVGKAWAMLSAGCAYRICRELDDAPCITDGRTIWLELFHPAEDEYTTAYLPTIARLERHGRQDWY